MALARQSIPVAIHVRPLRMAKQARLAAAAAILASVCGLAAFVSLVLHDGGQSKVMVNEQTAPAALVKPNRPMQAVATPQAGAEQARNVAAVRNVDGPDARHTFSINESTEIPVAGSMKLKLIGIEPAKKLYDLRVVSGRRWYTHRHLRLNEPLWIAVDKQTSMETVISSIENDTVSGYWTVTSRPTQVSQRIKAKHRHS